MTNRKIQLNNMYDLYLCHTLVNVPYAEDVNSPMEWC